MIKGLGKLEVWIICHIKERAEKEIQPLLMKFLLVLWVFQLFKIYYCTWRQLYHAGIGMRFFFKVWASLEFKKVSTISWRDNLHTKKLVILPFHEMGPWQSHPPPRIGYYDTYPIITQSLALSKYKYLLKEKLKAATLFVLTCCKLIY